MSWIEETLRQFGESIGIAHLSFNASGVCCLSLEERGDLYIERGEDAVFVYLARRIPYIDESALRRALGLTHFRNVWPLPVVAGLRGEDGLIFLARIEPGDFSLPALDRAIRLVMNLHEQVLQ